MSDRLRWLVSGVVVLALVAFGVWLYLRDGSAPDGVTLPTPARPHGVDVDTPELRDLKAKAGIETCRPGPGGGGLPSVTLPCLGGGPSVALGSLKGPMLLSFWQSACGPCREEMPALQAFYRQYGDRVPVVGVDFLDQFPGTALEQMRRRGVTYPSLADPLGDLQSQLPFAKVRALPVIFFLDAQGRIAYTHTGGLDSEAAIKDVVQAQLGVNL